MMGIISRTGPYNLMGEFSSPLLPYHGEYMFQMVIATRQRRGYLSPMDCDVNKKLILIVLIFRIDLL
jgi:hypothetical protein